MANCADQYRLGRCLLFLSDTRSYRHGAAVHGRLVKSPNWWSASFSLWNKLLNLYAKCGPHAVVRRLFDEMRDRDIVSYNTLLSTVLREREDYGMVKGLRLYSRMLKDRILPNNITISMLLGAVSPCVMCGALMVEQVHCHAVKLVLERDVLVGGSLIGGYSKCGRLEMAVRAFEEIEEVDVVCWNMMIDACARCGSAEHAVKVFSQMRWENGDGGGPGFDYFALTSVLKTCSGPRDLGLGMQLHACALLAGLDSDTPVGNALITMYSKCEAGMESAPKVFWAIQYHNIISWTAMISGFAQNGLDKEAVQFYMVMSRSGLIENEFCFASVLPAFGGLASIEQGRQVHARAIKSVFGSDLGVGNALIDMYFKCGSLEDAQLAFVTMANHDGVSWTAMISGFGHHGKGREAVEAFNTMGCRGFWPDEVTFLSVLAACSHVGLVDEGLRIFHSMNSVYGIRPNRKHCACIVDMLGRAGKMEEAERFIKEIGMEMDPLAWEALLGTCGIHGEVEIGRRSAKKVMELEPNKDGPYVQLSNLYAEGRMWGQKGELRQRLDGSGLRKEVAHSWSMGLGV